MAEKNTIARPYAQAVFDLATSQKNLPAWSEMLALTAAVVSDKQLQPLIGNPRIDKARVVELIIDICGDRLDTLGQNMIKVLNENNRLALLPEIAAQYELYRAEAEKAIQAEVITAFPVSDEQQVAIAASLKKRLGRDVTLVCKTDKTLIGGAIIRAGDMVIDGSVIRHLDRLASALSH